MEINIAGRLIGHGYKPLVVAEVSANHNNSFEKAIEIIEASIAAGADAIKLQTYTPDTMTIKENSPDFVIGDKESLWYGRSLYDLYAEASTPWEWHQAIFDYCKKKEVLCFSTPFDETAVDFLEALNMPVYKVASFEMTDLPLIKKIASIGKPMIISTGLANQDEIQETVTTAKEAGCTQLCLLHCVSSYPAKSSDYNLKTISDMAQKFQVLVGLSDHTLSNVTAVTSVALGVSVIEKHVTLRREDGGPDSAFSLEPAELKNLCGDVRTAWEALGSIDYGLKSGEVNNIKFRRSIYAIQPIKQGETFTEHNMRRIRPGFGLAPKYYEEIIGRKAAVDIERGAPMKKEYVE